MSSQLLHPLRALLRSWPSWLVLALVGAVAQFGDITYLAWILYAAVFIFVPIRTSLLMGDSLWPLYQQKGAAPQPPLPLSIVLAHLLTALLQVLILLACALFTTELSPYLGGALLSAALLFSLILYLTRCSLLLCLPACLLLSFFCAPFCGNWVHDGLLGVQGVLGQLIAILYAIPFLLSCAAKPQFSTKRYLWQCLISPSMLLALCAGIYTFDTEAGLGSTLAEHATLGLFYLLIPILFMNHAEAFLIPQQTGRWHAWRAPLVSLFHILLASLLVYLFQQGELRALAKTQEFCLHSLYVLVLSSGFLLISQVHQKKVSNQQQAILWGLLSIALCSLPLLLLIGLLFDSGALAYLFYGPQPSLLILASLALIALFTALRAK